MIETAPHPISMARLRAARENGFLNARCRGREGLIRAYGVWCWRMGLPMLWYEPRTPRSRLSRLHLDLFTGPGSLPVPALAALIAVSARYVAARHGAVTPYGAVWDRLDPKDVVDFARAVFRCVRRSGRVESEAGRKPRMAGARVVTLPVQRSA